MRRLVVAGVVGAMLVSLLPAGAAVADDLAACEGAPEVSFEDGASIAVVHAANVACMVAYGIAQGFPDGTYRPGEPVSRQQMALFIARMVAQAQGGTADVPVSPEGPFDDLGEGVPDAQRDAINFLASLGITTGVDGGGSYDPGGSVTREQMASFIARAHEVLGVFEVEAVQALVDAFDGDAFSDIDDASEVHRANIELLQAAGVVRGFDDGSFRPGEPVTRQQMSMFIIASVGVLDAAGLWNGVFVGVDPETPETPDTPVTPDVPDTPDTPEPTNQAYTVIPDATQVPDPSLVSVVAEVGEAQQVSVWLLDADDVVFDGLIVSFEVDDDGDFAAGLAAEDIDIIEVDETSVPASQVVEDVEVVDGQVELVISAAPGETATFVVLVAETDEDVPEVDADGMPVVDFGVSPVITVQDVDSVVLFEAASERIIIDTDLPEAPMIGKTLSDFVDLGLVEPAMTGRRGERLPGPGPFVRPEGEDITVAAVLLDDSPLEDDAQAVILEGELAYRVLRVDAVSDRAAGSGMAEVTPRIGREPLPADECSVVERYAWDGAIVGDVVQSGTAQLVDGVALFDVEGGDDGEVVCVLTRWEGTGAYDDETAENFEAASHGGITFTDAEPVVTRLEWADDLLISNIAVFAQTESTARVRVRALDQFGDPVAGARLSFTAIEGGLTIDSVGESSEVVPAGAPGETYVRTTNAAGIATLAYTNDESRADEIDVIFEPSEGDKVSAEPVSTVGVIWYEPAVGGAGITYNADDLLYAEGNALYVRCCTCACPDDAEFLRFDFTTSDLFFDHGNQVTYAQFRNLLFDEDGSFNGEMYYRESLRVTNYRDGATPQGPAAFTLRPAG